MSKETAMFPVMRGATLYKCKGSDLNSKVQANDLIVCQQDRLQQTFKRDQLDKLNVDAADREFTIVRQDVGMNPTNGLFNPDRKLFYGGEFKAMNHQIRSKWEFNEQGQQAGSITFRAGNMFLGYGKDEEVVVGCDPLNEKAKTVDCKYAMGWRSVNFNSLNVCVLVCLNRTNGVTQYITMKLSEIAGGRNVKIHNGFDNFTNDIGDELTMNDDLDYDMLKMKTDDEAGMLYGISINNIWEFPIDNITTGVWKVFNGFGQSANLNDIYLVDGHYYVIGNNREIYWGKYGQSATKYTMPKNVGDKDWGFYPPQTKSISGDDDDEVIIGGQYGALYTCKRNSPDPATWDWKETIHTNSTGTPYLFMGFVSNNNGTYLALASEYYLMSTLPEFIVPVTDTNGMSYKVRAKEVTELFT